MAPHLIRPLFILLFVGFVAAIASMACSSPSAPDDANPDSSDSSLEEAPCCEDNAIVEGIDIRPAEPTVELSDSEWRDRLSSEQYRVLRQEGTERAHSGELLGNQREGIYHCAGCGHPLFSSDTRYDSGTGWPSFWEPLNDAAIGTQEDHHLSSPRVEVHCARCGGHLGHVFGDGPEPTGHRYCLNSAALDFEEQASE